MYMGLCISTNRNHLATYDPLTQEEDENSYESTYSSMIHSISNKFFKFSRNKLRPTSRCSSQIYNR